jgi:hypothetical protein
VVLSLALNRAQFPLPSVVLFRADSQSTLTVTMAVVEIPLINATVSKGIFAHTKLAAIHKLTLKSLITCLIIFFTLAMLQVFGPHSFIHIPILLVFVRALTRGCQILYVAYIVTPWFEQEYPVCGLVLG